MQGKTSSPGTITALVAILAVSALAACDDDKSKGSAGAASASASVTAQATAPSATPSAAPSASADPPKKKDIICNYTDPVTSDNPAIVPELRRKLSKKPDEQVKWAELPNVRSINLTQVQKFDEIDPCIFTKLSGLHDLFLPPGEYYDLTPIKDLNQLLTLRVAFSKVADLKPLEKLTQLDRLDISHSAVRDITTVGLLVNLTEIALDETEVKDLTALATCKKLEKVSIKKTLVSDLSPLKSLPKLKYVYIEGSAVTDTSSMQSSHAKIVSSGR